MSVEAPFHLWRSDFSQSFHTGWTALSFVSFFTWDTVKFQSYMSVHLWTILSCLRAY